jgi:hypothetical protein
MISFLIPQSMLTGSYFKNLRAQIEQHTLIKSITRMIDRTGVVGKADIQMMVLTLETIDPTLLLPTIDIRVVRNGSQVSNAMPTSIAYDRVIKKIAQYPSFWVVSDERLDYEICDLLEEKSGLFEDHSNSFVIGNGGFVWNQNKSLLFDKYQSGYVPLVSAASLSVYGFAFPYVGSHATHRRSYVKTEGLINEKSHRGQCILMQRTTPKKTGRRIVASILPSWFVDQHDNYFLENHVNYISQIDRTSNQLFGLLGWLNSDLLNFVFQLRNGSTLVSVYEIKLLPISWSYIAHLTELVQQVIDNSSLERKKGIREINSSIYEYVGLGAIYQERIESVLAWKEQS